ncbi:MAG: hypothetical protein JO295_03630 [Verrucomicrobia bacterium]|nr:hypothetical protein [Verrucomicrobiota bacterium]
MAEDASSNASPRVKRPYGTGRLTPRTRAALIVAHGALKSVATLLETAAWALSQVSFAHLPEASDYAHEIFILCGRLGALIRRLEAACPVVRMTA